MEDKVKKVVSQILKIELSEVSNNTGMDTVEEWDSLKQMQIVMALEDELKIVFAEEDLFDANSVEAIVKALEK